MPLRIVISGATGRMGRELVRLIREADDLELVGGIHRGGEGASGRGGDAATAVELATPEEAGSLIEAADAVIDFSAPELLSRLLESQADGLAGRALVVGTTGLEADVDRLVDAAAARSPVVVAANFSIGVNVLLELVERAALLLDAGSYDAEVVEAHHRGKADAPSGTALALASAIAGARGRDLGALRRDGRSGRTGERPRGEIGLHAVRGGGVAGEHRVLFLGDRERLELAHAAQGREIFAEGALAATRWAAGREPGRYAMREVLGMAGTGEGAGE